MRHRLSLILLTVALLATVCLFGAMVRHVQNAAETVLEWPEPRFVLGGVTQIPQDGGVTHADIWDEKEHVCSRGDTFRSISQAHFNTDKYEEAKRHWGGGIMGAKAQARTEKKRKALESAIKI